ncbi:MAG: hypothetical protein ABH951_01725 [Patescibacteria group bacterium]
MKKFKVIGLFGLAGLIIFICGFFATEDIESYNFDEISYSNFVSGLGIALFFFSFMAAVIFAVSDLYYKQMPRIIKGLIGTFGSFVISLFGVSGFVVLKDAEYLFYPFNVSTDFFLGSLMAAPSQPLFWWLSASLIIFFVAWAMFQKTKKKADNEL